MSKQHPQRAQEFCAVGVRGSGTWSLVFAFTLLCGAQLAVVSLVILGERHLEPTD